MELIMQPMQPTQAMQPGPGLRAISEVEEGAPSGSGARPGIWAKAGAEAGAGAGVGAGAGAGVGAAVGAGAGAGGSSEPEAGTGAVRSLGPGDPSFKRHILPESGSCKLWGQTSVCAR